MVIGLGRRYARLGTTSLCVATDHICTTVGLYLCDDWPSGALTCLCIASSLVDIVFLDLQISLNLLAQIIPGTLLPGQPLANMIFKVYSVQTLTESTSFVQDLKLGHYIKIPPRATFIGARHSCVCQPRFSVLNQVSVQLVSTLLGAFLQVGVKQWIFSSVPDICAPDQKSHLTCPHNKVFFTASAIWSVVL
jgi:hypothetical protein